MYVTMSFIVPEVFGAKFPQKTPYLCEL